MYLQTLFILFLPSWAASEGGQRAAGRYFAYLQK